MTEGSGVGGPESELPQTTVNTRKFLVPKDSSKEAEQEAIDKEEEDLFNFDPEAEAAEKIKLEQKRQFFQEDIGTITQPYFDALDYKAAKLLREKKAVKVIPFSNMYQGEWTYNGYRFKLDFDKLSGDSIRLQSFDMEWGGGERLHLQFKDGKLISTQFKWEVNYSDHVTEDAKKLLREASGIGAFISTYGVSEPFFEAPIAYVQPWAGIIEAGIQIDLGSKPKIILKRKKNYWTTPGWNEKGDTFYEDSTNTLAYNEKTNLFENPKDSAKPKIDVEAFRSILSSTLARIPMDEVEI